MRSAHASIHETVPADITDDDRENTYLEISRNCPDIPHSIAVGDLNNDDKNDPIGRLSNGDIWFSPNIGGGNGITWGNGWLVAGGSGFTDIAVGDLNNDGKNDLVGQMPNGDLWFSPNVGGGNGITWGTGWWVVTGSSHTDFAIGDLNNDGTNDVTVRMPNGDLWSPPTSAVATASPGAMDGSSSVARPSSAC